MILLPWLSDHFGRKLVATLALILMVPAIWMLMNAPAVPLQLFFLVLLVIALNTGVLAIGIGPLAGEIVPPHLASTASGVVIGFGEIIGGFVVPTFMGIHAQANGISQIFVIALIAATGCLIIMALLVREPKYRKTSAGIDLQAQPTAGRAP